MELVEAPNSNEKAAHTMTLPAEVNRARLIARRGLLSSIEAEQRGIEKSRATDGLQGFHDQAFRMVTSPSAKRALSVDLEPPLSATAMGESIR